MLLVHWRKVYDRFTQFGVPADGVWISMEDKDMMLIHIITKEGEGIKTWAIKLFHLSECCGGVSWHLITAIKRSS